ncbi:hypothetical protein VTJ04DRAFT_5577 [Mycothermus thermophilus]|uniref:uncharacterized protein n=1 Tax=Humicola insolens TaxID=85995 RepID=UPI00374227F8
MASRTFAAPFSLRGVLGDRQIKELHISPVLALELPTVTPDAPDPSRVRRIPGAKDSAPRGDQPCPLSYGHGRTVMNLRS